MGAFTNSVIGGAIGIVLVLILMIAMYRIFGIAADLALLIYVPALLWWLVISGAVLTLPGIAGLVLSIGMAVDANVIVNARVREEMASGKSLRLSTRDGFKKSNSAVFDSQITTIIAALVLYQFGTGPVKGFAFTLASGIIIGLITAMLCARSYTDFFIGVPFLRKKFWLGMEEGAGEKNAQRRFKLHYIKNKKVFYLITVGILAVGIGFMVARGFNLGIDFTGGTRMQINMGQPITTSLENKIDDTLKANGITDAELVSYTIGDADEPTGISIKTTKALDNDARAQLTDTFTSEYGLGDDAVQGFEQFGPSIGKMLQKNAVTSVLIAAAFMLIYIIIRFKWRYGVASIVAVFHDVAVLIMFYAIVYMPINNPFIAAVLTIVGYSINDTIVVFDRIRENFKLMPAKTSNTEVIDTSINQTLVRSLMTSVSTLIAIVPLVILGGDTIRQFAVPLMVGIICGAWSSISIASPIYFELTKIGDGGEGMQGRRGHRSRYQEQVAKSKKASKKLSAPTDEDMEDMPITDMDAAGEEKQTNENKSGKNGKGGGSGPKGGGSGGGKGKKKKSKHQRRSDGAVV
jgi:SecD/SecF fusion protein